MAALDILGLIGSALQAKGAKKAATANTLGQQAAADYAMEGSMPWNVGGTLGGVKFDSEDAAQRFYEQEMALVKPEQAVAREQLDAQLQARGMLGASGGAAQASALAQAQGNVRLSSRQSASDRVQAMIDNYRNRISGDVTGAIELGQQTLPYGQLGVETGGMLSSAAIQGSQYLSGAALSNMRSIGGRYASMGNALRSFRGYGGAGLQPTQAQTAQATSMDAQLRQSQVPGWRGRNIL